MYSPLESNGAAGRRLQCRRQASFEERRIQPGVASATQVVRKERGDKVAPRKSREGNSLVQGEDLGLI